jgi:threonine synthase
MGRALGIRHMAMPTNGNAGAALAAYATSCGIKTTIFCPADTPEVNVSEIELQGATVYRVNGRSTIAADRRRGQARPAGSILPR